METGRPKINVTRLTAVESFSALAAAAENGEEKIADLHIKNAEVDKSTFAKLQFTNVVFDHCRLIGCKMPRSSFTDVLFANCDVSNCSFADSSFTRCRFVNSKAMGTVFADNLLRNFSVFGCNFQYAGFGGCRLQQAELEECDLSNASFAEASIKNLILNNVKLAGTSFYNTPLKGTDLSRCNLEGIGVAAECKELEGTTMDILQLTELAALLGITLK